MKSTLVMLMILMGYGLAFSQVSTPPSGTYQDSEDGSVCIPIAQGAFEEVKSSILGYMGRLKVDEAEIEKILRTKLNSWVDDKKKKDPNYSFPWDKVDAFIAKMKNDTIVQVIDDIKTYNDNLDAKANQIISETESFFNRASPGGVIGGSYSYWRGHREPGQPGWALSDKVHFPWPPAGGDFVTVMFGISPFDVNVSVEAVAGLSLSFTVELSGTFTETIRIQEYHYSKTPASRNTATTGVSYMPQISFQHNFHMATRSIFSAELGFQITYPVVMPRARGELTAGVDTPCPD